MASISIRHNKNGSTAYVVRAYVCRDEKGKAHYLSKTYTPSPEESERSIRRTLSGLQSSLEEKARNQNVLQGSMTFALYGQHFLRKKQLSCGEYTLHSYRISLYKACEYIGHVPLEKLNSSHLDAMTRHMKEKHSQYGKPYSAAYIRHILTIVRMVLGQAVREGVLTVNIADRGHYALPPSGTAEPVFLELEEARQYIRAAMEETDPKIRSMILLYLFTGVRMEELCGLQWEDIDAAGGCIHIRRASVYVAGQGVITKVPKTRSAVRTIRADPIVFETLEAYRKTRPQQRAEDRLYTKKDGGPLIPGTTAVWLRRFALRHGLRPVTPHKLRHTYATLQIFYGTDIRTVAGVMGHSSPMTTLTIYAHQVKEASEKASRAMSDMLVPK